MTATQQQCSTALRESSTAMQDHTACSPRRRQNNDRIRNWYSKLRATNCKLKQIVSVNYFSKQRLGECSDINKLDRMTMPPTTECHMYWFLHGRVPVTEALLCNVPKLGHHLGVNLQAPANKQTFRLTISDVRNEFELHSSGAHLTMDTKNAHKQQITGTRRRSIQF